MKLKLNGERERMRVWRGRCYVYLYREEEMREKESTTVEEDQWSKTTRALRNEVREIRMYSFLLCVCARGLGTVL